MTSFIPGIGMMGYGQFHNVVKEVATPLLARALVITEDKNLFCWIHLEQAFVTIAIKQEVVRRLHALDPIYDERTVLMTAQHTHAAPGGYSHYPFYNFTIPGFQTRVFEKVCQAAVEAVLQARRDVRPSVLRWGEVEISPDKDVAFNRSMAPYLNNSDAPALKLSDKHLGVDRRMQGLNVYGEAGELRAHLNWFAVHNTSVSSYNQRIHHDNKGVAADLFEKAHPGALAFFFQSSAGDVSPNFRWDKKLHRMVGKFDDQYESAAYNGEIQFRAAESVQTTQSLSGELASFQTYADMKLLAAPAAHGVGFFMGTLEGPGVPRAVGTLLKGVARVHKFFHLLAKPQDRGFYESHGKKDILLDNRTGTFAGIGLGVWKKLPPLPDPTVEAVRKTAKKNALNTLPWVPEILPFQLARLGELLIVAVPGEITTHAGKRLTALVEAEVKDLGVTKVLLTSYANAYMGYITTPEEYDLQAYEGGHTIYGRHTLDGITAAVMVLVKQLRSNAPAPSLVSAFQFPPEELKLRSL